MKTLDSGFSAGMTEEDIFLTFYEPSMFNAHMTNVQCSMTNDQCSMINVQLMQCSCAMTNDRGSKGLCATLKYFIPTLQKKSRRGGKSSATS